MPFVSIRIVDGVLGEGAAEKKAEISHRVTEVPSSSAGIPHDHVWVGANSVAASKAEE